jgi:hypothetical protein
MHFLSVQKGNHHKIMTAFIDVYNHIFVYMYMKEKRVIKKKEMQCSTLKFVQEKTVCEYM